VVEIDRPTRPARRNGAKTDDLDAVRAAHQALSRDHLAQPRQRGDREAMRVLLTTRHSAMQPRTCAINHLKALVVNAPAPLRDQLRALATDQLLARCAGLRSHPTQPIEHRATIIALRRTARRVLALQAEADDLHAELDTLVGRLAPRLLAEPGIGVICPIQLLTAWSHARRLRSEAAFAVLGGAAPIEASSGKVVRRRLNRSGDRQLNRALHTIVLSRMTHPCRNARLRRPPDRPGQDVAGGHPLPHWWSIPRRSASRQVVRLGRRPGTATLLCQPHGQF
jgi:transposase